MARHDARRKEKAPVVLPDREPKRAGIRGRVVRSTPRAAEGSRVWRKCVAPPRTLTLKPERRRRYPNLRARTAAPER